MTHDLNSALFVADRLALHRDGQIAYLAEPEEFMKIDDPIIRFLREASGFETKEGRDR